MAPNMSLSLAPPVLVSGSYQSWRKEMKFWEMATSVEPKRRAPIVFLSLSGKAREVILEMDPTTLNTDGGLDLLYGKLDELFKVDAGQAQLSAYEKFEKFS